MGCIIPSRFFAGDSVPYVGGSFNNRYTRLSRMEMDIR
jgi:hypothetical protein